MMKKQQKNVDFNKEVLNNSIVFKENFKYLIGLLSKIKSRICMGEEYKK